MAPVAKKVSENKFQNGAQKFVEWILVMLNSKNITEISKNDLLDTFSDLFGSNYANSEDSMNLNIMHPINSLE